ncbi:MAG: proline--tRNA ligase, partial [Alicyclobacillus shizuokensis]|nr:proline--tRNA ligase [Alicyclobacillus shizuokensis]
RDIASGQVTLARRATGEKLAVPESELAARLPQLMDDIQATMYQKAKQFADDHSHIAHSLGEITEIIQSQRGFVLAGWCGDDGCERRIKEEAGATSRNIPFQPPQTLPTCAVCGRPAAHSVWYAKAY